jgi:hypothetical protein
MNEYSLHSAIKKWYSLPGDQFEVKIDNYVVDILRGDLLIEIQTRNFSAIKKKLADLVKNNRVRLVHPIPEQKWIIHVNEFDEIIGKRKSPKKGKLTDLFHEMIRIPKLISENNFSLEVLMTNQEEVRCDDGKGSWRRRGASIKDRKLIGVNSRILLNNKKAFLRFLPKNFDAPFTNKGLANSRGISISIAQKITYCLKKSGIITVKEKKGKELTFVVYATHQTKKELSFDLKPKP